MKVRFINTLVHFASKWWVSYASIGSRIAYVEKEAKRTPGAITADITQQSGKPTPTEWSTQTMTGTIQIVLLVIIVLSLVNSFCEFSFDTVCLHQEESQYVTLSDIMDNSCSLDSSSEFDFQTSFNKVNYCT